MSLGTKIFKVREKRYTLNKLGKKSNQFQWEITV